MTSLRLAASSSEGATVAPRGRMIFRPPFTSSSFASATRSRSTNDFPTSSPSAATSPVAIAAASSAGAETDRSEIAALGPTFDTLMSISNSAFSSRVSKPKSRCPSCWKTWWTCSVTASLSGCRATLTRYPTPRTSTTT